MIFRFQEKGLYDVPVSIDFIVNATGYEKMVMISYSEGTTNAFVMGSERPEYRDRIKLLIAIGPSLFLSQNDNMFVRFSAPYIKVVRVKHLILNPQITRYWLYFFFQDVAFEYNLRGVYVLKDTITRLVKLGEESPFFEEFCAITYVLLGVLDINEFTVRFMLFHSFFYKRNLVLVASL